LKKIREKAALIPALSVRPSVRIRTSLFCYVRLISGFLHSISYSSNRVTSPFGWDSSMLGPYRSKKLPKNHIPKEKLFSTSLNLAEIWHKYSCHYFTHFLWSNGADPSPLSFTLPISINSNWELWFIMHAHTNTYKLFSSAMHAHQCIQTFFICAIHIHECIQTNFILHKGTTT
jgi:hypothetical protein